MSTFISGMEINMEYDLIYDFNEHGLYYDGIDHIFIEKEFILTIDDTIELFVDYNTKKMIYIGGFLPLVRAIKKEIKIYSYIEDDYCIQIADVQYFQGVGYDFFHFFEDSREYFFKDELLILYYEELNSRILLGRQEKNDQCIKINKNIYCGFDIYNNLKFLILSVDRIKNKD